MKKIPISRNRYFAIVDEEDFKEISKFKWQYTNGYAKRIVGKRGSTTNIWMHRVITKIPNGLDVDHINFNKLDNRKGNLRICTRAQNVSHSRKQLGKSGIRGVRKMGKKWQSRLKYDGKMRVLGTFITKEEAAICYNKEALKLYGIFAYQNKI